MGWEHRSSEESGPVAPLFQLEQKKSAEAGNGALQLSARRVRDSSAMLLSRVNSERMRSNSHPLQKGNVLLDIRKKNCCESHQALDQAPRQSVGSPALETSTQNETGQGPSNLCEP